MFPESKTEGQFQHPRPAQLPAGTSPGPGTPEAATALRVEHTKVQGADPQCRQQNSPLQGTPGIKEAHRKPSWLYLLQLSSYKACKQIKRRVPEPARDGEEKTSPCGLQQAAPPAVCLPLKPSVCLHFLQHLVTFWIGFLTETHLFHVECSLQSPGDHKEQQLAYPV